MRYAIPVVLVLLAPGLALGADHLLISEVAYDVPGTGEPAEYIELLNPTDETIVLNDGTAAYYLTDDEDVYWEVVNGPVANSGSDWVVRFPVGSELPAHGLLVVVKDSDGLAALYPGGIGAFLAQPGAPQLFEFQLDVDGIPDMVSVGTGVNMSLTNGGEDVTLFYWDGVSDLVADVDHVTWVDSDQLADKTGVSIDGPDADSTASSFADDAATATAAPDAAEGTSIQRLHALEPGETTAGGNGIAGHDETTEDLATAFVVAPISPGRIPLVLDGDLADVAAASAPLAVSGADGPAGGPVADFGGNGTVTELYALGVDADLDGLVETLWVGVRGEFFADYASVNGTWILIDVNPGSGDGVDALVTAGDQLADISAGLDGDITEMGVELGTWALGAGIAFDAVAGFTASACSTSAECGLRGFGTDGVAGTTSSFAILGDSVTLGDQVHGAVDSALPAAPGAGYAAPHGLEFALSLADLGYPATVALAVVSSADWTDIPSPNMLPENPSDAFDATQVVSGVACVATAGGEVPMWYLDADSDGFGDDSAATCGNAPAGWAAQGGDCDDGEALAFPGNPEICGDGVDNDCDPSTGGAADLDGDGHTTCLDCDDGDASVHPGAPETPDDGVDQDCSGFDTVTCFVDADGDGFGGPYTSLADDGDCADALESDVGTDCHDGDTTVFPGALETADDGVDQDCSGFDTVTCFVDADGDGFGGPSTALADDGDCDDYGESDVGADCHDGEASVFPGAPETADDGVDQDCSGSDTVTCFVDADGDTFGVSATVLADDGDCADPGESAVATDCDDAEAAINPGVGDAGEACDDVDSDCDGDLVDGFPDADGDGTPDCIESDFDGDGDPADTDCDDLDPDIHSAALDVPDDGIDQDCNGFDTVSCFEDLDLDGLGSVEVALADDGDCDDDGESVMATDCDDDDASVYPGAPEVCNGGVDDDCDPATDEQVDSDGDGSTACDGDCDDAENAVHPGADEACDGLDNDCDAATVEDEADVDGDGWRVCDGDCDDGDGLTWPGAPELCDGLDNDCDEEPETEDEVEFVDWFEDLDGDGFGADESVQSDCQQPEGWSAVGGDCEDGDSDVHPDAAEVCDGVDNDCDPVSDIDGSDHDADGDGILGCTGDCDDDDPSTYPGAIEVCEDEADQDCDGTEAESGGDPECLSVGCSGCSGSVGARPVPSLGVVTFLMVLLGRRRRCRG